MIVIDTTVLVYAKGDDHPLREPCRALIAAITGGHVEATTTVEVIQELAHVRARRRGAADAAALARDYAELLSPLLMLEREHLDHGLSLFESVDRLGAFDAVLAAATLRAGPAELVSADGAFADVPDLSHVVPDVAGVDSLLS
jgi:predicted nucleic acid-binding protein